MICVHCSTPVADEANFCHSCGSMVSDAGGQAAATAAMDKSSFANMERLLREETKGEYTVGKLLGRGGMAVVYLAEEIGLGRKVALKVLPPELTFGHGVDRFLREAKTAATLDHPHIIPIYRIASGGKLFWYAMKYLEGQSLEDVLREKGAFSLEETIRLLEQVADALDYAHDHQVIHRDIKPANVMLDNRKRVIITDFGIAKALSEGALTASGSVIGTPYFMSPEQGMGKPVSGASDQYSVGVMAFRMLAGHVPYDGDSAIDILHKHCMMEIPRLDTTAPHLPRHVCAAVEKAMAKKAAERFPDIRSFVTALREPNATFARPSATVVMTSEELQKVNSGPQPPVAAKRGGAAAIDRTVVAAAQAESPAPRRRPAPTPPSRSKVPLVAALAVLALGGGGFAAWKMLGQERSPAAAPPVVAEAPETVLPAGARTAESDPASGPTLDAPSTPGAALEEPAAPSPTPPQSAPRTAPANERPVATTRPTPRETQAPTVAAPVTAAPPTTAPAPAATAEATLQLLLPVPGVVSIDGVLVGERTRLQDQFSPGDHLIRVEREGFVTKDTIVSLKAGETTRVTLRLQAKP